MEPREIADSVIALYSLPMKIIEVGMLYGAVFLNSVLPVLTVAYEKREHEKAKKLIRHAAYLLFGGGLFGSLLLFFGAAPILELISTKSFADTAIICTDRTLRTEEDALYQLSYRCGEPHR